MKKVNLEAYQILPPGATEPRLYAVKQSLINLLFGPHNNLGAMDLLERDDLARRIRDAQGDMLMEEAQYQMIRRAVEGFRGYGEFEVELVRRVLGAESVEVEEVKEIKAAIKTVIDDAVEDARIQ